MMLNAIELISPAISLFYINSGFDEIWMAIYTLCKLFFYLCYGTDVDLSLV